MRAVIVRDAPRASRADVDALAPFGVATVHEAQGRTGLLRPYLRPVYPGARATGTALTILSQPGDNLMIHAALDVCREGDILIVAMMSESTDGMFGELLAESARAQGAVGLVIDAGVRDTSEITAMEFPVWSRAVSAQGTVKATAGSVNVPVVCGGVTIYPGDVIVADDDGVVCVRRKEAATVAQASASREAKETETRKRLRAGELGLDMYGMRAKLEALGVEYVDGRTTPAPADAGRAEG